MNTGNLAISGDRFSWFVLTIALLYIQDLLCIHVPLEFLLPDINSEVCLNWSSAFYCFFSSGGHVFPEEKSYHLSSDQNYGYYPLTWPVAKL